MKFKNYWGRNGKVVYDNKRKLLNVNPAYGTYNVLVLKP